MEKAVSLTDIKNLTDTLVKQSKIILGENLTGIYLHGSAAMGGFNKNSDVDIIIVIKNSMSDKAKLQYMDMLTDLNRQAPAKGIELSIVKEEVCNPFVYPTPYELHFSIAHLKWYISNPRDYIEKMKGTDKDLAAHFTIVYYRGKTLFGKEIKEVFAKVGREDYFDSIWHDIENCKEEIMENPIYIILNLCRVLAYKNDELILSKQEGGSWGLDNIPERYHGLISAALTGYRNEGAMSLSEQQAKEYAAYMLEQIKVNKDKNE